MHPTSNFTRGKYTVRRYRVTTLCFRWILTLQQKMYLAVNTLIKIFTPVLINAFTYHTWAMQMLPLKTGHLFGQVPYPLLTIFRANQTYAYDLYSYNLMNFLEFVADHYESIDIDQHFSGFFFNKIPLFKKLKWREVASFKAIYGGLSSQNDPALHPSLYQFPVTGTGQPITYALGKTPYVEGSVGIENIFKFVRVDLVRRFTYLDHPDVAKFGIRTLVQFSF